MKKVISILLVISFLLCLGGCGTGKAPEEPDNTVYRKDVQDYVKEVLDATATISIFEVTGSTVENGFLTVSCVAMYSGDTGENKGTFTLTYSNNKNEWSLEKCRVELDQAGTDHTTKPNETTSPVETTTPVETTAPVETTQPTQPSGPSISITPGTYGYSLTQVGSIKDPDRDLSIQYDALLRLDGKTGVMLSYLGQDINKLVISGVEYLGNGAYVVQSTKKDVNCVGLISQDGELLIPDESCKISWPKSTYSSTDRYLIVTYITGETTNKDECFVYASDSFISFGPQDGDKMYTGYSRVYDLKNKKFVDNLKITNRDSYAMQPCGDNFFVTDENDISILYNDKGENIFQTARRIEVGNGTFIVSDNGTYRVYDEDGNQTYTSNKGLYPVKGDGGYVYKYENDRNVIMDRNGNQVGGMVVEAVYEEIDGVFKIKNSGKYGLLGVDGTVILPCEKYDNVTHLGNFVYMSFVSGDNGYLYTLINKGGIIVEGLSASSGIYELSILDGEKAFVVNDKAYSLTLEDDYPQKLMLGLIGSQSDSNGLYGLFDLFSGEQLLKYEYEVIKDAAGYIYAYKNGEWSVFQVDGPEK